MTDVAEILVAIRRINRAIDLHSKQLGKTAGLTVPQLLVLQSIRRGGQKPINKIATDISLSQATVTTVIDRLERNGLVRRERSDVDRRVVSVMLTENGCAKLDQSPEPMQESFIREFAKLPSWEQHMLAASLQRLASMMDAETIDASPILVSGEMPKTDIANGG